jgi:hypothetical protein
LVIIVDDSHGKPENEELSARNGLHKLPSFQEIPKSLEKSGHDEESDFGSPAFRLKSYCETCTKGRNGWIPT